ncbi:sensor histidine kinase [Variovorax saccharolyticus]|uniref:sensor histidine kinase n=1 Tax=Variovorax saccharolyticus TaxID=3053516 RepID=UPI0025772A5D|nr:hypothetical protein [Variovorax sp. J31P216]MDM0027514.1 hypothetical protein [Variovorax sp. J31P216]
MSAAPAEHDNITPLRLAERQRDEALRFLSHDARVACATIIGMVELTRASSAALGLEPLLSSIEREARAGLSRCDGFLALARAEAQPLRLEALDLVSLLQQSIDQAWPLARERQVRIRAESSLAAAPCEADRGLLARALQALLQQALERCTPGADLHCGVAAEGDRWCVVFDGPSPSPAVELHCRLARTVARRHGGSLETEQRPGGGRLRLRLPKRSGPRTSHEEE